MNNYYYLAASLPMLRFDAPAPIRGEAYLKDCGRLTFPGDFVQIQGARLGSATALGKPLAVLRKWQDADFAVRNELAKSRAKKKGTDAEPFLRKEQEDPSWATAVRQVLDEPSPLKAEQALLRLQWQILSDLEVGHFFDLEFLVLYFLKLQILERKTKFQVELGQEKLDTLLSGETNHGQ